MMIETQEANNQLKIIDHQDDDNHDEAQAVSNHLRILDDQNSDDQNGRS